MLLYVVMTIKCTLGSSICLAFLVCGGRFWIFGDELSLDEVIYEPAYTSADVQIIHISSELNCLELLPMKTRIFLCINVSFAWFLLEARFSPVFFHQHRNVINLQWKHVSVTFVNFFHSKVNSLETIACMSLV